MQKTKQAKTAKKILKKHISGRIRFGCCNRNPYSEAYSDECLFLFTIKGALSEAGSAELPDCGGAMVSKTQDPSLSLPLLCDFLSKLVQWCKMAAEFQPSPQIPGSWEENGRSIPLQRKSLEAPNLTSTFPSRTPVFPQSRPECCGHTLHCCWEVHVLSALLPQIKPGYKGGKVKVTAPAFSRMQETSPHKRQNH